MFERKDFSRGNSLSLNAIEPLEKRLMFSVTLPNMRAINTPVGNPALPAGFDLFLPPVGSSSVANGSPTIAASTNSANAGDSLVVSGKQLSANSGSSLGADTQFITYGQTTASNGSLVTDAIDSNDGTKASITLGSSNTANSFYLLWAQNARGYSNPVAINGAQAWWMGPNAAAPGSTVAVYGENLSYDGGTTSSWIYIAQAGSSSGQWATVTSVNPYQVQFTIPSNLSGGNYQVWVHNGEGGKYGWSSPLTLSVTGAIVYNGPVFNVKNYGAIGNGKADDTKAILRAAVAAMNTPNSTIYLPAGTYIISYEIGFGEPSGSPIQFIGAGAGQTIIKCASSFSKTAAGMINAWGDNVRIANLTLDSNSIATLPNAISIGGHQGVQISGVAVNTHLTQYFDLTNNTNVAITNSSFIGSGGFLGNASQVLIDGCNFYGTNDATVLVYSWGGQYISITNCTAQDYNDASQTGWAAGRFFVGSPIWGSESNIYLGGNTTTALGVRPGVADQDAGEQILFEQGNLAMFPSAVFRSATATTVTFSGLPANFSPVGLSVAILNGAGVGQTRSVTGYNSSTGVLTLDTPWAVAPDSTSVVRIGHIFTQVVVYNNHLSGKGITNTASSGVNFYGGCFDCAVDDNTISNVRLGVLISSLVETGSVLSDDFILVQNNLITNSAVGVCFFGYSTAGGIGLMGNVIRDNDGNNLNVLLQINACDSGDDIDTNIFTNNTYSSTLSSLQEILAGGVLQNLLSAGNS